MGVKNINEQDNKTLSIKDAISQGCFTKEKLPWFTIDTDFQPKTTKSSKLVVTGKNSKGEAIWLYEIEPKQLKGVGKNMVSLKTFEWGCDTSIDPGSVKGKQDAFITDLMKRETMYTNVEPSDYLINREFEKVDLSTLSNIFKPNEKFIYKRISTKGTSIQQQDNIEKALNLAGWTLTEPDLTLPEHDKGMNIKYLLNGKYVKYYQPLIDMNKSTMVYPMTKAQKEEQSFTGEMGDVITDPKELLKMSKTKEFSKSECKTAIKTLYNMSKIKKDVDDATLLNLKTKVWSCYRQNTKFNEGSFGVGDELKSLQLNFTKYGIGDFIRNESRQGTNESVNMKNIIKENLIKASKKKQNLLLSESTIIVNRYKILTENINPKSKKDVKKFFDLVINETAYLHSQNFNKDLIKESFFDLMGGLFGNASTGVLQYFKEHIATWLVTKFGFDPNSWLGNIIVVGVGNLPITELHNLTNCSFVSKMLAKDIAEGAVNKIKNDQGLTGPGYDILRNAMTEMVEQSSFGQSIEHKISDFICPKLQGLTSKLSNVTKDIKSKALKPNTPSLGDKVKNLATTGLNKVKSLVS